MRLPYAVIVTILACAAFVLGSNCNAQTTRLYVESGINHSARSVAFSLDGKFIAAGGIDREIRVWSISPVRELLALPNDKMAISLAFHPSRNLLSSFNEDGTLTVWDLDNQRLVITLECHRAARTIVRFSDDGSRLLCGDETRAVIRSWLVEGFKELLQEKIQAPYGLRNLQLDPLGTLLAGIDDNGYTRIYDRDTWQELYRLDSEPYAVDTIAFAPHANRIATVSGNPAALYPPT